jgi:glycosyltransferase involved in cell wall biosynthesis
MNRISTHILVASTMVKNLMAEREGVPPAKIKVIPYGFQVASFRNVEAGRVDALRKKYFGDRTPHPVVGVISRFLHLKGIQHIIPAFRRLREHYPGAVLMLANAKGPYEKEINALLAELPAESVIRIPFEDDIAALYLLFDVFVHVPVDHHSEAFGQIYIEALAAGVPSVFTLSGIAHDVIRHEHNALVTGYGDPAGIYEAIVRLLSDRGLAQRLAANGKETAAGFEFSRMAHDTDAWLTELADAPQPS